MQCLTNLRNADLTEEREFAEKTSLHGVGQVAGEKHWTKRLFWVLACLGAWAFLLSQLYNLLENYHEHKTTTSIVFTAGATGRTFPAVTFCDFNRINGTALEKDLKIPRNDTELLEYILLSFEKYYLINRTYSVADVERIHEKYTNYSGRAWNFSDILDVASKTNVKSFVKVCRFWPNYPAETDCNNDQALITTYTSYGSCLTFNLVEGKFNLSHVTSPGVTNGLTLVVDTNPDELTGTLEAGNPSFGLKIKVHESHQPPQDIGFDGYNIRPGSYATIGLKTERFMNEEPPWGECDKGEYYGAANYSESGCDMMCKAAYIRTRCKCEALHLTSRPPQSDMRLCEFYDVQNCTSSATSAYENMSSKDRAIACGQYECRFPCSFDDFLMSVSSADFPSPLHRRLFREKNSSISQNSIMLDINFMELWVKEYREHRATTRTQLLSDFGGQMGLCIGASLLTIAEIGEFLLSRLLACCPFCKKKNSANSPDNENKQKGTKERGQMSGNNFSSASIRPV